MINRREFFGITVGAGATLALKPQLLRALEQSRGQLIQRAIPSSGEKLPVIGLGFANHPSCTDPAVLKEVLKTFFDNGGRAFDTQQGNATDSEQFHATVANELGIQNKLFLSMKGYRTGVAPQAPNAAAAKAQIESLLAMFKVPRLDLVLLPFNSDPTYWDVLKEAKKAGRIRYIGAGAGLLRPEESLSIMRNEPIDFISVDYAVDRRAAEEKILPLALERKIAVMASRVFGGANGLSCTGGKGLFGRVGNTPLPEWAAEFDAKTWAQFFLKYVISHPAITVARVGTTRPHHMLDNIGGGIGRLPNEAMRKRMAEFIDALPMVFTATQLDRFAGEYKAASGFTATFRHDGATLFVKTGTNPEVPLVGRSYTRFVDPQGSVFEFITAAGQVQVTSAILEQGGQKIPLQRK